MPVEDRADVGSFWSGYVKDEPKLKRPRRVDETIGNQAGEFFCTGQERLQQQVFFFFVSLL